MQSRTRLSLLASTFLLPALAHAFGAIAVDDRVGIEPAYGFSTGEPSRQAAERNALRYCKQYGSNCRVVVWFETCGAYAASKKVYGYGYGATKAKATAQALSMCGNNQCEIVVAKCE